MQAAFVLAMILSIAQPGVPDKGPPMVPTVPRVIEKKIEPPPVKEKREFLSYYDAVEQCKKTGKPLVVFIGYTSPREIKGMICAREATLQRNGEAQGASILVSWDGQRGAWLSPGASDQEIREAAGLGASRTMASPFDQSDKSGKAPTADDSGPWLSREEEKKIRAAWPKNVPYGKTLRFYRLAPRYQSLLTTNGGRTHIRIIDELHGEEHHLTLSGGMASIDHTKWKSIKGLDIPEGKRISVWEESTDVRAFSLVPRWRWRFPVKTIAYDVLFSGESIFEIRTQTRAEKDWETKVIYKDTARAPAGYNGAGQACASCHARASEVVGVPGRIYLRVRWGDDNRFSWRPFLDDNSLDERWPLERQ